MSDFEDRLAALDPAAGQPYQHGDLDALISRITTQPAARKFGLWRKIELKVAGTLITGALVTAGSVAVFQGGASLPVLAIQSTAGANAPKSFGATASGAMQIYEKFNFFAGPGLTATIPTSPSYQLQIPSSALSEAARVAGVFGVTGVPANTNGDGTDWLVTGSSGSTLDFTNVGVAQWTYTGAPSANSSTSNLPSQATLASDVQRYMKRLGYDYTLSAPSFGTTSSSSTGTSNSTSTEDVTYTVDVAGISTDQNVNFSVDANNNVVSASGPAFSVGPPVNYPLQSLKAGVNALNAEQQSRFPTTPPTTGASNSGSGTSSGVNPGSAGTTSPTPSGPPVVDVTLDADSLTMQTYQLTDGSLWLLPVYHYTGNITSADGSTSTGTWNELAVDPTYVHVGGPASSHGVINY